MRNFFKNHLLLTAALVVTAAFSVTGFAHSIFAAATTIGTNITTTGNLTVGGNVGVGTTSPYSLLSVQATAGGTTPLFTIASSTSGAATSTALTVLANGYVGIGIVSPSTSLHVRYVDATTNTIVDPLRVFRDTSGTPAAGIGTGIQFTAKDVGGAERGAGTLDFILTNPKSGGGAQSAFSLTLAKSGMSTSAKNSLFYINNMGRASFGGAVKNLSGFTIQGISPSFVDPNLDATTITNNSTTLNFSSGNFNEQLTNGNDAEGPFYLAVGDRLALSSAPTTFATVTGFGGSPTTVVTVDTPLGDGTLQTVSSVKASIMRLDDSSAVTKLIVNDLGYVGIGYINPGSVLTVNGSVGIGTTTPYSKFQVTSGASATTTVNFGEVGNITSHACFNTKNTAGADISFYFVGTTMVVENNLCR